MITEYSLIESKGFHLDGKTPYHYWMIKLGENLYYKTYNEKTIETTDNERYAAHIANEKFALELIGFIQNFYDKNGQIRPDNIGRVIPPLVGLAEASEILGWDKRKVSTYIKRGAFPKPLKQLASGPIWTYKQIEDYRDATK